MTSELDSTPQPPATPPPPLLTWARLQPLWPSLPAAERRHFLAAAARALHALWQEGVPPAQMPLQLLAFQPAPGGYAAVWPARPGRLRRPAPADAVLALLADWLTQARLVLSPRDLLRFFHAFLQPEQADQTARAFAARGVARQADLQVRERAARIYGDYLTDLPARPAGRQPLGRWDPDPGLPAGELADALAAAAADPATLIIKQSRSIRVLRASLLGQDVLIQQYDVVRLADRLKYRFRASRARRAWAAARTLVDLDIGTPEPLGFLEEFDGRTAVRSQVITRFQGDAVSVYAWCKAHYRSMDAAWRERFGRDLRLALLRLYDRGVYHADTKASNLLMTSPEDGGARAFLWIDLECVQPGARLTRYRILRNLVQLNGALRRGVTEAERMAFLQAFARRFPWAGRPAIIERIRRWTQRRLLQEVRRHCGH